MQANTGKVIRQAVTAGLLGFAVVAVVLAIGNVMDGRSPFFTAAALGAVFLHGTTDPTAIVVSARTVMEFLGLHLLIFLAFGFLGAWFAALARKGSQLWYPTLFFWIFVAFHMVGAVQMAAFPIESVMPSIALWVSGALSSLAMAIYLFRANPRIMQEKW